MSLALVVWLAGGTGVAATAAPLIDLVAIPDVNGNATAELAALVAAPGATGTLYVRDAASGASIGHHALASSGWSSLALLGVRDGQTVLLGVLQQHTGGAIRVALRNAATGALVRNISFLDTNRTRTAIGATFVPDAGGAGVAGVAVLALNETVDERPVSVEVRRVRNAERVQRMYYDFTWAWAEDYVRLFGIASVKDQNGNGSSEIPVLGLGSGCGTAVVAHDSQTGQPISPTNGSNGCPALLYLSTGRPVGFAPVSDASGDGQAEIAVLGRLADGRSRLQLRELLAGSLVTSRVVLEPGWKPRFIRALGDVDGNGAAELALGALRSDGRITVDVHDGASGLRTSRINFLSADFSPHDLEVVQDLSANGIEELALIGRNRQNGALRIQIRDARNGTLIRGISLP